MKKNEMKEKLADIASFFACILVILAIAYFTGFLKGFGVKDFADAFNNLGANLSNSSLGKNAGKNYKNTGSKNSGNNETFEGYQVARIPEAVLRGVKTSHLWTFLFNSNKKVVFYIYDDSSAAFNSSVQNYLSTKKNAQIYSLYAYTNRSFSSMNIGNYGASKICNSLEECNEQRQRASDYSLMSSFLKYCGKTMCVINSSSQKYIRLTNKDSNKATQMLNALKYW